MQIEIKVREREMKQKATFYLTTECLGLIKEATERHKINKSALIECLVRYLDDQDKTLALAAQAARQGEVLCYDLIYTPQITDDDQDKTLAAQEAASEAE